MTINWIFVTCFAYCRLHGKNECLLWSQRSDGLEAKRDIYNAKSEINCLSALFQPWLRTRRDQGKCQANLCSAFASTQVRMFVFEDGGSSWPRENRPIRENASDDEKNIWIRAAFEYAKTTGTQSNHHQTMAFFINWKWKLFILVIIPSSGNCLAPMSTVHLT